MRCATVKGRFILHGLALLRHARRKVKNAADLHFNDESICTRAQRRYGMARRRLLNLGVRAR